MNIFKNKYYKIFPLSIFITKCTGKKVTFGKIDQLNICKTYISFDKESNILKEEDEILYQNGTNYTVNKYFKKNEDIIKDRLFDLEQQACQKNDIIEFLKSYKYLSYNVYKKKNQKEKLNKYNLDEDGFDEDLYFYLYFYKKLDKKIKLLNSFNQELNINKNKITTKDIIKKIGDINESDEYEKKIYEIITIFYPKIKSSADKIISINDEKINKSDKKNKKNKKIFENFIKDLDQDDNVINIVLDDYYDPKITNILLSKDLEKIYKITEDKKKDIKDKLNVYYEKYKYSSLQAELDKKNVKVKIENGNNNKNIEKIDDVTITIIEDNGKDKNKVITPKQCTIEFNAGNNLFFKSSEKYKSKNIKFSEGGITTDTNIEKYIKDNYKEINGKCTITPQNGNDGKFKDGTIVTVTINEVIDGITTKKDPNKVYVKVEFKVSDDSKFRFKGKLATSNNFDLEFEKNKKITDLLTEIIIKLDNKDLKDGYKIKLNNKVVNNDTKLVADGTYTITLADNDPNFVEEIKQTPIETDKPGDTDKAKRDDLINECKNLLSDIKNLDSSYNEPINETDTAENLESLKDKLTSKLKALKNKKPEENNNNNNNDDITNNDSIKKDENGGYSGKKKSNKKCCKTN